jgi:hypothetical protein
MYRSMTDESDTSARVARRRWLGVLGASLSLGVAGCLGDSEDSGEDDGSSDDGTADGDTSDGSDDSDTDDGGDSSGDGSTDGTGGGDDGSGDDSSDDDAGGGDGSGDDGSGDDGSDDEGEPAQPDVPVTLTDLRAAQVPITVSLGIDDPAPIAVTVANDGDTAAEIPVQFAVVSGQDGVDDTADGTTGQSVPTDDALASQTLRVTLTPGASERLTASGLTDGLEQGSYTVAATAGDQQATLGLDLFADSPVPVTVYTQAAEEQYRVDSGQVTVRDDGEAVATASLDSQPVTVELPLARTTRYTVEVTNLDGGAWPNSSESVTVDSASDPSIDIVAGYEIPEVVGYRFSTYRQMGSEERIGFGLYSTESDYQFTWIDSLWGRSPYLNPDDAPPEYGADLSALGDQLGALVSHAIDAVYSGRQDYETYFYLGPDKYWEPGYVDFATGRGRELHSFGTSLRVTDTADDLHREYEGRDSVRDTPVDVYRVPEIDTSVYVDPETGHALRAVRQPLPGKEEDTYEIVDFFDHGGVEDIDWELLKARSVHETGTNSKGETLERLPWEIHQSD